MAARLPTGRTTTPPVRKTATTRREGSRQPRPAREAARHPAADSGEAAGPEEATPVPPEWRDKFSERLAAAGGYLEHGHPLFWHGRGYEGPDKAPKCTWKSDKKPRDDHDAPKWLTASEYCDEPEVMQAKARQLANLMRVSRKTVAYTGAGISASVIGQAARSGENKVGWKGNTREAKPTFTHHALGLLGQRGLINSWVQQNHDGLPQKAGYPQENINEIHGSWYDPSNPVVKYSGELHDRAYPWMEEDGQTADLVIVLGTSLGGLNADQVPVNTASRSKRGRTLGSVIINLQQTEQDGKMSLRMFGRSDDILKLLLLELGFGRVRFSPPTFAAENKALVPYDKDGMLVKEGGRMMWLNLEPESKIRITPGHNIQGAKQPMYMHIGAKKPVTRKGVTRDPAPGFGKVRRRDDASCSWILTIEGQQMRLGLWWLESAKRGAVPQLPIVNADPVFETRAP